MLRYQFLDVGKKMPLHVGAGPRVLLAHMDDAYIDKWLKKHKLIPWTENTITDPQKLKNEIIRVREQGYSQSIEDVTVGAAAIAAPVWGSGSEVIGALSIAGASINFQDQKLEDYINITKSIADQLSQRMGWEL
jgi:DNA-binding IclR family transcriptional regulator